jgi:hypothetical protein
VQLFGHPCARGGLTASPAKGAESILHAAFRIGHHVAQTGYQRRTIEAVLAVYENAAWLAGIAGMIQDNPADSEHAPPPNVGIGPPGKHHCMVLNAVGHRVWGAFSPTKVHDGRQPTLIHVVPYVARGWLRGRYNGHSSAFHFFSSSPYHRCVGASAFFYTRRRKNTAPVNKPPHVELCRRIRSSAGSKDSGKTSPELVRQKG